MPMGTLSAKTTLIPDYYRGHTAAELALLLCDRMGWPGETVVRLKEIGVVELADLLTKLDRLEREAM